MGFTQIPTPGQDFWIEIASTTPTSGSSISFTSINPSFRKLLLSSDAITLTAADYGIVRFNSISSTNSYIVNNASGTGSSNIATDDAIYPTTTGTSTLLFSSIEIDNPQGNKPVFFRGILSQTEAGTSRRFEWGYVPSLTASVTQIDLTLALTTFAAGNTGTVKLYGTY